MPKHEDDFVVNSFLGHALVNLADIRKREPTRPDLLARAEDVVRRALNIRQDDVMSLNDLAYLLLAKAEIDPRNREHYYNEAKEVLDRVNRLDNGAGNYYLACIHALSNDEQACRQILESTPLAKMPPRAMLANEPDLEHYADRQWFKLVVSKLTK
jgi:hypothetical protein